MTRRRIIRAIVVLGIVVAVAVWLRRDAGPEIASGSTLLLELSGSYIEAPAPPLISRIMGDRSQPFAALLSTLAMAERDDRLSAVVLRIRGLSIGWGKAQELRDAIGRVRAAGRKTLAFLELSKLNVNHEYYVATAASEIYAIPGSALPIVGLAAEYLYLGGLMEKLGLQFEVTQAGKYKSAVETLAGTEMSGAAREMANSMLDSLESQFVAGVASGRDMSAEEVRRVIDDGPVLPRQLQAAGLIDGVSSLRELALLRGPVVKGSDYQRLDPASIGFAPVADFALVYGSGNVVSGRADRSLRGSPVFASDTVGKALHDAASDPQIDAIVLRIDSPGGSSLASEVIWQAVRRAKSSGKPIVASFSDVAASGGYYVAVGTDAIVSPPGALTGSIGAYILRPVLGDLFDKLGVGVESLTRGRYADFLLSSRTLSEESRARMNALASDTYDLFVKRVAAGRHLAAAEVNEVGQGRVWTGEQALEAGLVDELGGLHAAVQRTKKILGLDEAAEVALIPYPKPRSLPQQVAQVMQTGVAELLAEQWLAFVADRVPVPGVTRRLERLLELPPETPLLIPPLLVEIR